ncbi:MAG: DUF1697 domain-containing protein [Microcella sp.]
MRHASSETDPAASSVEPHAFLLRAVNVGGTAKLPMAELRALAADLGATGVSTYIASGNLLCTPPGDVAAFVGALEDAIEQRFEFRREVIARSLTALRTARDAHPFDIANPAFSYITSLTAAPSEADVRSASGVPRGDDEWTVIGSELHVRYERGASQAGINTDALLRRLGVTGTARNLRTVNELVRRLSDDSPEA